MGSRLLATVRCELGRWGGDGQRLGDCRGGRARGDGVIDAGPERSADGAANPLASIVVRRRASCRCVVGASGSWSRVWTGPAGERVGVMNNVTSSVERRAWRANWRAVSA
jgi:hypothetical protein